jgi:hypothetical protein
MWGGVMQFKQRHCPVTRPLNRRVLTSWAGEIEIEIGPMLTMLASLNVPPNIARTADRDALNLNERSRHLMGQGNIVSDLTTALAGESHNFAFAVVVEKLASSLNYMELLYV